MKVRFVGDPVEGNNLDAFFKHELAVCNIYQYMLAISLHFILLLLKQMDLYSTEKNKHASHILTFQNR